MLSKETIGNRDVRHLGIFIALLAIPLALPMAPAQAQESRAVLLASLQSPNWPAARSRTAKAADQDRNLVTLDGYSPGTIVVRTRERRLYYVVGNGTALRYRVGVGRPGKQWAGHSVISGKYLKPAWSPPQEIRRDNPALPPVIPAGSPGNPMGAAAMTLAGSEYAIHGTNAPGSIGGFVSYGCIRMHNADILELFDRVAVGTPVIVEQ